jgi:hypothetical protein
MAGEYQCRHTCCSSSHTASSKSNLKKHEATGASHRACSEVCPFNSSLRKSNIRVETHDSFLAAQHSQQTSASSSRASSVSKSSSRKRSREPTADEDAEQILRQERARRLLVVRRMKIYCILDETRVAEDYNHAENNTCWVDWECPQDGILVKELLDRPELKGYVFQDPVLPTVVRIYDWVSCCAGQQT